MNECYVHCAKAFLRSSLWKPETWVEKEELPSPARMLRAHATVGQQTEQDIERSLQESYTKRLY
ncbi:phosphohydrolase [Bacillus sp. JCM 19047]|nr:phosphohydrolase [Bacillus sp. JCM 19047]